MNPLKSIGYFLSYHFNDVPGQFTDAARQNDVATIVMLLDRYGPELIDKSSKTSSRDSALMEAAANGHSELVDFLVARGADVNYITFQGRTPLIAAAEGQQKDIMQKLIGHGANKAERDGLGRTAADILVLRQKQAEEKKTRKAGKSASGENYMTSPAHITNPLNIYNPYNPYR